MSYAGLTRRDLMKLGILTGAGTRAHIQNQLIKSQPGWSCTTVRLYLSLTRTTLVGARVHESGTWRDRRVWYGSQWPAAFEPLRR
jgi:hypothetical protein